MRAAAAARRRPGGRGAGDGGRLRRQLRGGHRFAPDRPTRAPMGGGVAGDGALIAMARCRHGRRRRPPRFDMLVEHRRLGDVAERRRAGGNARDGKGRLRPARRAGRRSPPIRRRRRCAASFAASACCSCRCSRSVKRPARTEHPAARWCPGRRHPAPLFRRDAVRRDLRATEPACCSSMTFWPHLGPDLGFLQDSGYAVIRFALVGRRRGDRRRRSGLPRPARAAGRAADAHRAAAARRPNDFSPATAADAGRRCCKETDAEPATTKPASISRSCSTPASARWCSASRPGRASCAALLGHAVEPPSPTPGRDLLRRDLAGADPGHAGRPSRATRWSTSRPAPRPIPGPASSWPARAGMEQVSYQSPGRDEPASRRRRARSRATPIRASPTRPRTAPPIWS